MIKIIKEKFSRYDLLCFNELNNLVYSKQFFDNRDLAIKTCNRYKNKYNFVEVIDNRIGHCSYNPYEKDKFI